MPQPSVQTAGAIPTRKFVSRILFVGEGVALAHVSRTAVLARWAREAGHEVSFACDPRYAHVARQEGLDPVSLETIEPAVLFSRLAKGGFMFTDKELRSHVQDEIQLIQTLRPQLIVGDFRLTLPISAAAAGVRCLSLLNAHLSPGARRNLTAPDGGLFGLLPDSPRQALFSVIRPLVYRYYAEPLNRIRRDFGLPTLHDFREHYSAGDACAYLDLPEFAPVERMPDNHFYLGPVIWRPRGLPSPNLGEKGGTRPLAYVTMGSTGDLAMLPPLIASLLKAGCDLAVSGIRPAQAAGLLRQFPALGTRAVLGEFFDPTSVLERAALT